MVMKQEGSGSNPGGVKCFPARLLFESNSSDISRFMSLKLRSKALKCDENIRDENIKCNEFSAHFLHNIIGSLP